MTTEDLIQIIQSNRSASLSSADNRLFEAVN